MRTVTDPGPAIFDLALDCYRTPLAHQERLTFSAPLPEGMNRLLWLANGSPEVFEEAVRQTGASQVDTNEIGLAILEPLRDLDEVAYLRFASVYQAFDSLDDFEASIARLRADHARAERSE